MAVNAKIFLTEKTKVQDGEITEPVLERSTDNQEIEVTEYVDRLIEVASDAANVEVGFAGMTTGEWIRIEVDNEVRIRFDAVDGDLIKVKSHLILHGEFTALYVSGNGETAAVMKVFMGGE